MTWVCAHTKSSQCSTLVVWTSVWRLHHRVGHGFVIFIVKGIKHMALYAKVWHVICGPTISQPQGFRQGCFWIMLLEMTKMDSKTMTTTSYGIIRLRYHVWNFRVLVHVASYSTMENLDPQENSYTSRVTRKNVGSEGYIVEECQGQGSCVYNKVNLLTIV